MRGSYLPTLSRQLRITSLGMRAGSMLLVGGTWISPISFLNLCFLICKWA